MKKLSRFELEIMEVLWRIGESSVREIQEAIQERKRPAYTTVQTIVQRLEQKGAGRRSRKIGNAFLFEPAVTKKSAYRRVIAHLLESGKLTLEARLFTLHLLVSSIVLTFALLAHECAHAARRDNFIPLIAATLR